MKGVKGIWELGGHLSCDDMLSTLGPLLWEVPVLVA